MTGFVPRQCKGCNHFAPSQQMVDAIFGGVRVLGNCSIDGGLQDQEHGCAHWIARQGEKKFFLRPIPENRAKPRYTPEQLAIIRSVAEAGGSMKEAANRTGRTIGSIANIAGSQKIRFNSNRKYARHPYSLGLPNKQPVAAE